MTKRLFIYLLLSDAFFVVKQICQGHSCIRDAEICEITAVTVHEVLIVLAAFVVAVVGVHGAHSKAEVEAPVLVKAKTVPDTH